jgi:hypothetical protein
MRIYPTKKDRGTVDFLGRMLRSRGKLRHLRLGEESDDMKLIVKGIVILVILGAIGVVGFAYLGDLSPQKTVVTKPVVLDGQ